MKTVEFRKLLMQASPYFSELQEIRWRGLVYVYRLDCSRREYSVQIPVEATCSSSAEKNSQGTLFVKMICEGKITDDMFGSHTSQ